MNKKEKQKFGESLTEDEQAMVEYRREMNNRFAEDEKAYKLGSLCDADYLRATKRINDAEKVMFKIAIAKREINNNKVDIAKGETKQSFKDGTKKDVEDLKIDNIEYERSVKESLEHLRMMIMDLYRHVDLMRIDKKIYLTKDKWNEYVSSIEERLGKLGLDLYEEFI